MNTVFQTYCSHVEGLGLGIAQRAQLILVILGEKPAAEIVVYPWNQKAEKIEIALQKAKLLFKRCEVNKRAKSVAEYAVSKDQKFVDRLLICHDPEEFARLMGYPETAIQAFVDGTCYDGYIAPDVANSPFFFKLSVLFRDENIALIRKRNALLEKYAPTLSEKICNGRRD